MPAQPNAMPKRRWPLKRRLIFRLTAILLGILPFVLLELLLVALDWGRPELYIDPFAGFSATRPLFVLDEETNQYEIPTGRQVFFRPESFPARKESDEFRIFCLGGSTVQGRPFAIETSFTTWLELSLQAADPSRKWNAVNCGGVSYASYRLVPVLQEVLAYEPDMIILYTGQNEFLEDRSYRHIKSRPAIVKSALEATSQLRTIALARQAYANISGQHERTLSKDRPLLPEEVTAELDYAGGLDFYRHDAKWRQDVIDHFRYNLNRMVRLAQRARVPILLMNPVSNIRDSPPFKAEHRPGITPREVEQFNRLWNQARESYPTNKYRSIELLHEALKIDDQHAGIYFDLGNCHDSLDMTTEAHAAYMRAKELDVCPLRILEEMNDIVISVARKTDTPLVDVRALFEKRSPGGIPGSDWLIDHVHPSIRGHQLIAEAVAEEIYRQGIAKPDPNWQEIRDLRYQEHSESLGDFYYAKGMSRLDGLRGWAQGRSEAVRPKEPNE